VISTVLIVDDYAVIRRALCKRFALEVDFAVCGEAENGWEAIAKAQALHPDVIVMDLSMPVMNGLDAARVLSRIMPNVPIIMFSAYCDAFTENEAQSVGISALVPKSEDMSALVRTARTSLMGPRNCGFC
jgi:DNA-binding NarL/FixJ family response regulator